MTQDEKWEIRYKEVKDFILKNGRNPSKYDAAERGQYLNWMKHNKKLYNCGELKEERRKLFQELLEICERYKHKNQYQ